MSDDPLTECPECNKDSLRRVISGGTGLIFKGSGYYLTDYKNKDSKKAETKDSKKSPKTEKKVSNPNKKSKTGEIATWLVQHQLEWKMEV